MIVTRASRPVSASVCSTFFSGADVATAHADAVRLEAGQHRQRAAHRRQAPTRQLAIGALLLLLELEDLLHSHLALEQHREDLAVALAIDAAPQVHRQRREVVRLGEPLEGLGVQGHVVDERAIEVEHDGAGAEC